MPRQNRVRHEQAVTELYPKPVPFRGMILRFLSTAILGAVAGIGLPNPADNTQMGLANAWTPVVGSGVLAQGTPANAPVLLNPGGAAIPTVSVPATKTAAQAAIGLLPIGASPRSLFMVLASATSGTVVNGQPLLRYGTLASPAQDFGIGISATDFFVGRTATAQQDSTTIATVTGNPALVGIMNTGTTVSSVAVSEADGHVTNVTRTLNTVVANPLTLGNAAALDFVVVEIIAYDHKLSDDELDGLLAYVNQAYGLDLAA